MGKKIIAGIILGIFFILIAFVFIMLFTGKDKVAQDNFIGGKNPLYRNDLMLIEYPQNWKIKEVSPNWIYLSPEKELSTRNLEKETYMMFMSFKGKNTISKEDFRESELKQIQNIMSTVKVEELTDISFDGFNGVRIVISGYMDGSLMKYMHLYLSNNKDTYYNIGYSAKQGEYDKYLSDANEILRNFKTKDSLS